MPNRLHVTLLWISDAARTVTHDVFANNRVSLGLISSNPINSLLGHWGGECSIAYNKLYETLTDAEYGHSYEVRHASFAFAKKEQGTDGSLFDWYNTHVCRYLVLSQFCLIICKYIVDREGGKVTRIT